MLALLALALGVGACGSTTSAGSATTVTTGEAGVTAVSSASGTQTIAGRTIRTVQQDQGGVLATDTAVINLIRVTVETMGANSFGLATAAGGGTITATNCKVLSSGSGSPCLWSGNVMSVSGGTYEAIGSEVARVAAKGSLTLTNAALSSKLKKCAVLLGPDAPAVSGVAAPSDAAAASTPAATAATVTTGAASDTQTTSTGATAGSSPAPGSGSTGPASFTMSGGSILDGDKGPVFSVEGCTGVIKLSGVKVTALSDVVLKAVSTQTGTAKSSGQTGATLTIGAHAVLTADRQTLVGDVSADSSSTVDLTLADQSSLVGGIDTKDKALQINLTLDAGSTWQVTEDSFVTGLSLAAGISGSTITSIIGKGHTVYYDPTSPLSSGLQGKTYTLRSGGYLKPLERAASGQ